MSIGILRRVDKARTIARRHELSIQPRLFSDVAVVRHWGWIDTVGQTKEYWQADEAIASNAAAGVFRQKQVVDTNSWVCPIKERPARSIYGICNFSGGKRISILR